MYHFNCCIGVLPQILLNLLKLILFLVSAYRAEFTVSGIGKDFTTAGTISNIHYYPPHLKYFQQFPLNIFKLYQYNTTISRKLAAKVLPQNLCPLLYSQKKDRRQPGCSKT